MTVFAWVKLGYKTLLLTVCSATLGGPSRDQRALDKILIVTQTDDGVAAVIGLQHETEHGAEG